MLSLPMDLSQLFRPEDLLVDFAPGDKWDAIAKLVAHLAEAGRLPAESSKAVLEQVLARERSMSTGMERGIAIPHAAVDQVDRVVAAMGIVSRPEGLSFESIDARPARLIVLLIIPRSQKLLHIRTLADVARVLAIESVREALLAARSGAQAWEALQAAEAAR
jgi:mannitol/fructose-specific phosphotransferase system IIA component (Ntr-type)